MSTPVKAAIAIAAVIALAVGVWLIRPLFVDTVVDEEFPLSSGAVVPDDMTQDDVEAEMASAASSDVTESEDMPGDGPTSAATGQVVGADEFHLGEGTATVFTLEDASQILRLEDFMVTNGPDLHVFLTALDDAGQPTLDDAVDLGQLKGNIGNQNYDIPVGFDTDRPLGVVVYCVPFSVTFATAVLG